MTQKTSLLNLPNSVSVVLIQDTEQRASVLGGSTLLAEGSLAIARSNNTS